MRNPGACDEWFPCPDPRPRAAARLFCFPFAGGGASAFHGWSSGMPDSVEVRSVQLPGRESRLRAPLFTDARSASAAVAGALGELLDRPFAFFGHSLGALVAFEVTRELRRRSAPTPARLLVSAKNAPHLPLGRPPVYHLPAPMLVAEIRRLFEPPEAAWEIPELLDLLLPIMRADMTICDTYAYSEEPPLCCPIQAFGGTDDRETPREGLEAWREQTSAEFGIRLFPGGHFYIEGVRSRLLAVVRGQLESLSQGR